MPRDVDLLLNLFESIRADFLKVGLDAGVPDVVDVGPIEEVNVHDQRWVVDPPGFVGLAGWVESHGAGDDEVVDGFEVEQQEEAGRSQKAAQDQAPDVEVARK